MTIKPTRLASTKHTFGDKVLLSEQRFQDLLSSASAFYAEAERDQGAAKANAIKCIQALMVEYGLSAQDLLS